MKEPIISEKHVEVEISQMKVTDGRKRKEKQRLWLQRPMTARLVFHGKNSEQKLVVLEGRAPAQENYMTRFRKYIFVDFGCIIGHLIFKLAVQLYN